MALRSSDAVIFVPSGRFFMRVVPLAPDTPALGQVELALEGLAPFPLAQLYWGCLVSADRTRALVYAAHRRRFTVEETAAWERADLVLPDSLPLLSGAIDDDARRRLAAEFAQNPGTSRAFAKGDRIIIELTDAAGTTRASATLGRADHELIDVRDRAFLHQRRRDRRQRELTWQLLLGGCALIVLAALLDLSSAGLNFYSRALRNRVETQAPLVQKLETAQSLTSRVDELTRRRLRFFEMLSTVNASRPRSIQFNRVTSAAGNGLEIEAQTSSSDDLDNYEAALRLVAGLERAEVHDPRTREGVTTFTLSVAFKPDATLGNGGGS